MTSKWLWAHVTARLVNIKASPRVTNNGTYLSLLDLGTVFLVRRLVVLGKFILLAITAEERIDSIYISMFHIQYETSSENKSLLILSEVLKLHSPSHLLLLIYVEWVKAISYNKTQNQQKNLWGSPLEIQGRAGRVRIHDYWEVPW